MDAKTEYEARLRLKERYEGKVYRNTKHVPELVFNEDYVIYLEKQVVANSIEQSASKRKVHVNNSNDRWVCQKCGELVNGFNVTFEEYHEGCGGKCV